jgi:hypothetical protein
MSIVIRVSLPVEVEYEYLPAEPQHGIPRDDIEVTRVELGGIDVTEGLESDDFDEIVTAIWEARDD